MPLPLRQKHSPRDMKVLKSWGTDGQVVISLLASDPEDLEIGEPVFIEFDGLPVPFFVESCSRKGSRLLVKFEDVDSESAASELAGREVSPDEGDEAQDDESVIGMSVTDASTGEDIGEIVAFDNFSGNGCITVMHRGSEVMIPFHEDLVSAVEEGRIVMSIPEGLLDIG